MPSSPRTPTRRRKSSTSNPNLSFISPSPQGTGCFPKRGSISRRSSQYSIPSPLTPQPTSYYDYIDHKPFHESDHAAISAAPGGIGSLADELAEAFHEDEEGENSVEVAGIVPDDNRKDHYGHPMGGDCKATPFPHDHSISPPKQSTASKPYHHGSHRQGLQGSQCDSSGYSDGDDPQGAGGVTPALEARMVVIEDLARRGTDSAGDDLDHVVLRVVRCLKDLGSQSSIENGASRLITTHAALVSHLSNQTRTVSILVHPLISPLLGPPDPDLVDDVLPLFASLLAELPIPTSQPLSSLHSLHASTSELTAILTYLSDTLHMTRQTTALASRRLRSATELVVDMRKEAEARDQAVRWLERGNWAERIADRECARVCGDVLGGFEKTCNAWRERLVGGLELVTA